MKRIISFSWLTPTALFLIFWSLFMAICCLISEFDGETGPQGVGILLFGVFAILTSFFMWALNRLVSIVWIENGIVKSKGLIYGFCKECPITDIKTVEIRHHFREFKFIYLIDDSKYKFDTIKKDSYIAFRKTKKTLEFLRTFWSDECIEIK